MVEGYREKDEAEWRKVAQHAAWFMQSMGSKVTADKLLRKPPSQEEVEESKELFDQAPDRR